MQAVLSNSPGRLGTFFSIQNQRRAMVIHVWKTTTTTTTAATTTSLQSRCLEDQEGSRHVNCTRRVSSVRRSSRDSQQLVVKRTTSYLCHVHLIHVHPLSVGYAYNPQVSQWTACLPQHGLAALPPSTPHGRCWQHVLSDVIYAVDIFMRICSSSDRNCDLIYLF